MGYFGERLSDCAVARSAGSGARSPGVRRGCVPRRRRIVAIRYRKLGAAYRRSTSAGSDGGGAELGGRRAGCIVGMLAANRQSVVGIRASGAGRSDDETTPGGGYVQYSGGDGSRILLGISFIEV